MRSLCTPLLLAIAGLSSCNSGDSGDKYTYDMGRLVEHAPQISEDQAAGQKLGGAEVVLLSVPSARRHVKDAWLVGTDFGWLAGLSQSRANAEYDLNSVRQGLCQVGAAEMRRSAEDVCGWGSYLKPEGKWLADTIAPLSLNNSRDFIQDELNVAERHACGILEDYRQQYPNDSIEHPELVARCDAVFKASPRNLIVMSGH